MKISQLIKESQSQALIKINYWPDKFILNTIKVPPEEWGNISDKYWKRAKIRRDLQARSFDPFNDILLNPYIEKFSLSTTPDWDKSAYSKVYDGDKLVWEPLLLVYPSTENIDVELAIIHRDRRRLNLSRVELLYPKNFPGQI